MPGESTGSIKHARRVLAQIRAVPEVDAALGLTHAVLEREREGPARRAGVAELLSVVGVDGDPSAVPGLLGLDAGRWLRRADEVVIGRRLSRDRQVAVGDRLRLGGRVVAVVGVGRLRGLGLGDDSLIYMDYDTLRERADLGDRVTTIAVRTANPADVRARLAEIGSLTASEPQELVARIRQAQATSVAINWIISLLALGIGALFVSSMLGRSVVERRLEFATLKAIGLPGRTILLIVALEAVLISLAATLVGIGVSRVFGVLIDVYVAAPYGIASLYAIDLRAVLIVLALALGLGLLAGLAPARRATAVDPVEILREA
jgi:ABC-type lipoprotein release transport system permease subunit